MNVLQAIVILVIGIGIVVKNTRVETRVDFWRTPEVPIKEEECLSNRTYIDRKYAKYCTVAYRFITFCKYLQRGVTIVRLQREAER